MWMDTSVSNSVMSEEQTVLVVDDQEVAPKADYSLFTKVTPFIITLTLVFVDDLLLAGSSIDKNNDLRSILSYNFHMKDLGELRYFLGLEVHSSTAGFFFSQKKYVLNLFKEYHTSDVTPSNLPMETHLKLTPDKGEPLADIQPYQKLLENLIYLIITRPEIVYVVHILT